MIDMETLRKSHGRKVTCEINGIKIDDAKISVDGEKVYICQRKVDGYSVKNQLGYKYSWLVSDYEDQLKDLRFSPLTLRDMQVGDTVIDEDGVERKILSVCGEAYLPSRDNKVEALFWVSFFEAEADGWKLKDQEEPKEPKIYTIRDLLVTMNEIADKLGIEVSKLKIKKD